MKTDFDWEGRYQENTARWDKGAPVPGLLEWIEENPTLEGGVAVPGCGRGHEAAAVALAYPGAEVVGIDISETGIKEAGELYQLPNLHFKVADFFAESGEGDLSVIIEHTCFCAIPPGDRGLYRDTCVRRLKKGGLLIAVFYLHPVETEDDPDDGPPWGTSVPEIDSFFGEHFETLVSKVPRKAFPGREMREILRVFRKI